MRDKDVCTPAHQFKARQTFHAVNVLYQTVAMMK